MSILSIKFICSIVLNPDGTIFEDHALRRSLKLNKPIKVSPNSTELVIF